MKTMGGRSPAAAHSSFGTVATIEKTWSFDAAHRLPNHDGKCRQLHGHTYSLTIALTGLVAPLDGSPGEGMVLDYYLLSQVWKEHLEPLLDHQFLNESLPVRLTTAEMIAAWALGVAVQQLGSIVAFVTVRETPATAATVWNAGD